MWAKKAFKRPLRSHSSCSQQKASLRAEHSQFSGAAWFQRGRLVSLHRQAGTGPLELLRLEEGMLAFLVGTPLALSFPSDSFNLHLWRKRCASTVHLVPSPPPAPSRKPPLPASSPSAHLCWLLSILRANILILKKLSLNCSSSPAYPCPEVWL